MRWTWVAPLTNGAERGRRSRVVLTPRRWRQVLRSDAQGDGDNKARSPGRSRRKPLKPSRAGMPGGPGEPTVTTSCAFYPFCTRDCGCIKRPAFPTPFLRKGGRNLAQLGRIRAARMLKHDLTSSPATNAKRLRNGAGRRDPACTSAAIDCFATG